MLTGLNRDASRHGRLALIGIAALLLFVQSFAVAHYHQEDPRWGVTSATRVGDTDALCAVCAFYLHFSTKAAPIALVLGTAVVEYRVAVDSASIPLNSVVSRPSPRAPPVSV